MYLKSTLGEISINPLIMNNSNFRSLTAYNKAFTLAMELFLRFRKHPRKKRDTDLQVRLGIRPGQYAHPLAKPIERGITRHILSASRRMVIPRILRQEFGWILHYHVFISLRMLGKKLESKADEVGRLLSRTSNSIRYKIVNCQLFIVN